MDKLLLLQLQFNVNSIGFKYWLAGIKIYRKNYFRYGFTLEFVYNEIAEEYNTTRDRVERALRTASNTAKKNIQKYYNYYGTITNKTIFELIVNMNGIKAKTVLFDEVLKIDNDYENIVSYIPSID